MAGIVIITVAALWAPHIREFDSIVKYFQQLMSYLCPPVVAVFLCGLFWKRATATGAFVGLMAGFLLAVSLMLGIKHTPLGGWNFLYVAPLIFLVSAAIIVGVSLLTDPPGESAVRRFVWNSSFYHEETAELATVPWYQNFRILSLLLLAGTGLFVFLWR